MSLVPLLMFLAAAQVAAAQQGGCATSLVVNGNQKAYSTCAVLTDWAHFAWTYNRSTNTLDSLFRALLTSSSGWAGWGINFGPSPAMVGAKVMLGFRDSTGTIRLANYDLTQATKAGTPVLPSTTSVLNTVAGSTLVDITGNVVISIFANVILPSTSTASLNLVWSRGPGVTASLSPLSHDTSPSFVRKTSGTIDLSSSSLSASSSDPNQLLKNRHGVLNVIGWGVFLPLGVMVARYLKPFAAPAWFYAHTSLQSVGYILGIAGWGLGLKLASLNGGSGVNQVHRNLGTAIFFFATLQVLAFVLRPKTDSKIRFYWNIYHRGVGYVALILIVANIYKGFSILQPPRPWEGLYTAFLVLAVVSSFVLEAYTWYLVLRRKRTAAYSLDSPPATRI